MASTPQSVATGSVVRSHSVGRAPIFLSCILLPPALIGLTAIVGTTALGILAISQIRRAAGLLYGMGLAVFDALLFPLLALDVAICIALAAALARVHLNWVASLVVFVVVCAVVDIALVVWTWRMVNRPTAAPAQ